MDVQRYKFTRMYSKNCREPISIFISHSHFSTLQNTSNKNVKSCRLENPLTLQCSFRKLFTFHSNKSLTYSTNKFSSICSSGNRMQFELVDGHSVTKRLHFGACRYEVCLSQDIFNRHHKLKAVAIKLGWIVEKT